MNAQLRKLYKSTIGSCQRGCVSGYILKNGEFVECSCIKEFNKKRLYALSNIPSKYESFGFHSLTDEFKKSNTTALKVIRKYVDNIEYNIDRGNGLYFQANPGLGKTAIATWILKQALAKNYPVYFTTYSKLINLFYKVVEDPSVNEQLSFIKTCKIVCIDRIDRGYIRDDDSYVYKRVDEIFSHFYDSEVALLVTSNESRETNSFPFNNLLDELVDIIFVGTPYRSKDKTLRDIMYGGSK